jgi:cell division protein FtsW
MNIENKGRMDWYILVPVIGLMLFSISFVFSASAPKSESFYGEPYKFFFSHGLKVLIGIVMIFFFAKIDYHIWQKYSKLFIMFSLIPLLLVFILSGPVNNVYRWIDLGPFSFQPSELAKFALITHLSTLLAERQDFIKSFKYGMMPPLIWSVIIAGFIAIQPNFSTAFVTYLIALAMMFIGNVNIIHLATTGFISILGAGIFAFGANYRVQRIMTFLGQNANTEAFDKHGYQTSQAIIAFGNGGFAGVGPGQSRQSNLFLPESFGDFIFSIIGEEYGYIGVILILCAFALIIWRGLKIIKNAPDSFGYFLASGIVITFCLYAMVNAGVNCGLLPNTGVPMPFISYGGTAVLIYSAAIGVLLNISSQAGVFPFKRVNEAEIESEIKK